MYLKRLTLQGFKSFADRTAFSFTGGITAIVGPNGCGKSNIVDALKWIFGGQSAKELRGEAMKDVIFAGTQSRRPVSFAEVVVTFDNCDGLLPTDHAEVAVARRLFRSGESEYRINGQRCRLRDVKDIFWDTGIGTESYSILEQGKIDILLQATPRERRVIFEEAAGISRYRMRREEALRQLARTEENLLRINDVIAEIESRIRSVRIQAGRARRYREIEAELRQSRLRLAWEDLMRLYEMRAEWTFRQFLVTERIAREDERRSQLAGECARWRERREALAEDVRALDARRHAARAKQQSLGETIGVTAKRIAELDEARDRWAREADDARGYLEKCRNEREALGAELQAVCAREQEVAGERAVCEGELTEAAAASQALQAALQREKERLVGILDTLTQLRNNHSCAETEEHLVRARVERLDIEEARMRATCELIAAEEADARCRLAAVSAERTRLVRTRTALARECEDEESHLEQKALQAADTQARIHALASRRELLARLLNDLEGVGESTRRVIHAAREGELQHVRGLLAELLTADAEDARAIETALGPWAQAIVVETQQDLRAVRDFLGPDAAFAAISLDRAVPVWAPASVQYAALAAVADRSSACGGSPAAPACVAEDDLENIEVLPDAMPDDDAAINGHALLPCETPSGIDAVAIAAAFGAEGRPDGQCQDVVFTDTGEHRANDPAACDVGGNGSGVIAEAQGAPLVETPVEKGRNGARENPLPPFPCQHACELVDCPDALAAPVRAILAGTLVIDDRVWETLDGRAPGPWRLVSVSGAVREPWGGVRWGMPAGVLVRRSELTQCAEELAWLEAAGRALAEEVAEQKTRLAALREDLSELAQEDTALHGRVQALDEVLKQVARRHADLDLARDTAIRERVQLQNDLEALAAQRAELHGALRAAEQTRIEAERAVAACQGEAAALAEQRRAHEHRIAELRVKEASARENARRVREARDRLEALIAERLRRLEDAQEECRRTAGAAGEARAELEALQEDVAAWARAETDIAGEAAEAAARLEELSQAAREHEAALAALDKTVAASRAELGDIQLEERERAVKAEHLIEAVNDECGIDLGALARGEIENAEMRALAALPPEEHLRDKVADLRQKLMRHGNVNLAAIDELKELEDRFGYLATQRDDIVQAKTRLAAVINDLNRKSRKLFAETFDAVNAAFGELFRKAFGGGRAELSLEEGQDMLTAGIEITVRPPGKKPVSIRLLSGGERTLTTLVLLFAVLRVRPTPFCVLDEVDAPLDEANVRRFLVLVDEFTANTQFLVITHNKLTMVKSHALVGITMEEKGVSKTIAVEFKDADDGAFQHN